MLADMNYIFMYVYVCVCLFCLLLAKLLIISLEGKAEDKQERKDTNSARKFEYPCSLWLRNDDYSYFYVPMLY